MLTSVHDESSLQVSEGKKTLFFFVGCIVKLRHVLFP